MAKSSNGKYKIGDIIITFGRNLKIINKEYREVIARKKWKNI